MIDFTAAKFDGARRSYIAANTPSFLAKRLRQDRTVIDLHLRFTEKQILDELEERLGKEPLDITERLAPLVLLSALSHKGRPSILRKFAEVNNERHPWLQAMASKLATLTRPTTSAEISLDSELFSKGKGLKRQRSSVSTLILES